MSTNNNIPEEDNKTTDVNKIDKSQLAYKTVIIILSILIITLLLFILISRYNDKRRLELSEEFSDMSHIVIKESTDTTKFVYININTADAIELAELSGIGETKAKAIIAYREANGDFSCIEDIMNVNGIGEAIFNEIKEHIYVE